MTKKKSFDEASVEQPLSALDKRLELARLKLETKKLEKESRLKEIELQEQLRRDRIEKKRQADADHLKAKKELQELAAQAKLANIEKMKTIYAEAQRAKELRRRGRLSVEEEHQLALIEGLPDYGTPTPEQLAQARLEGERMVAEYQRRQAGPPQGTATSATYVHHPVTDWQSTIWAVFGVSVLMSRTDVCIVCETTENLNRDTLGYLWCQQCGSEAWVGSVDSTVDGHWFPAVQAMRTQAPQSIPGVFDRPFHIPTIVVSPGTRAQELVVGVIPRLQEPQTWTFEQLVAYWKDQAVQRQKRLDGAKSGA